MKQRRRLQGALQAWRGAQVLGRAVMGHWRGVSGAGAEGEVRAAAGRRCGNVPRDTRA